MTIAKYLALWFAFLMCGFWIITAIKEYRQKESRMFYLSLDVVAGIVGFAAIADGILR